MLAAQAEAFNAFAMEKAANEAWGIYNGAMTRAGTNEKGEQFRVSSEDLEKAYEQRMPKDMLERLARAEGTDIGGGIMQRVFRKHLEFAAGRYQEKLDAIDAHVDWTPEQKFKTKEELLSRFGREARIRDFDRLISQQGVVDAAAMSLRYGEQASQAVVYGLAAQSAWQGLKNLARVFGESDIAPVIGVGSARAAGGGAVGGGGGGGAAAAGALERGGDINGGVGVPPTGYAGIHGAEGTQGGGESAGQYEQFLKREGAVDEDVIRSSPGAAATTGAITRPTPGFVRTAENIPPKTLGPLRPDMPGRPGMDPRYHPFREQRYATPEEWENLKKNGGVTGPTGPMRMQPPSEGVPGYTPPGTPGRDGIRQESGRNVIQSGPRGSRLVMGGQVVEQGSDGNTRVDHVPGDLHVEDGSYTTARIAGGNRVHVGGHIIETSPDETVVVDKDGTIRVERSDVNPGDAQHTAVRIGPKVTVNNVPEVENDMMGDPGPR